MILRLALVMLALLAPAAAHAEWHEASSEHFVVLADGRSETIVKFTEELEKFDRVMRVLYPHARKPMPGPANRVTVFVLSQSRGMEKLTGSYGIRGFYIPRAGSNVAFVPRVSTNSDPFDLSGAMVLRHEYAHHFMYTAFPAVFPFWFREGFAEYFSTVKFEPDGTAVVGTAPNHRGRGLVTGNPLPVERMVTLTDFKLSGEQVEAIYGRGWLLTHYLMSDAARQQQLTRYIGALNGGASIDKAAEAFGNLKELGKALDKHMLRTHLPVWRIAPEAIRPAAVQVRKLTPGEAATIDVRIKSEAGVKGAEARRLAIEARRDAAPFPDDPGAQTVLAKAEYSAGDFALAAAAADRAIAANPKMGEALYYRALVKFRLAEQRDPAAESWTAVRQAIIAANRADPEDPRPLMLFYRSFTTAGEAATKSAKAGLAKAYDTAPSDLSLRMDAALMFLHEGNRTEAREALSSIAFNPHRQKNAEQARLMVEAIDRGDTADKIAAIEAPKDESEKDKPEKD